MPTTPRGSRRAARAAAVVRSSLLAICVLALAAGCTGTQPTTAAPQPPAADSLLTVASQKDGDSFVASDGVEYRVGMVNTPEGSECGGSEASRRTYELLEDGFLATPYSTDPHGRSVARVQTATGEDLGLVLAREGLADDRYLEQFRHEHPDYAEELAPAFAEARDQRVGLWRSCGW